jgi:iron(III) transport system substrate-binding protein
MTQPKNISALSKVQSLFRFGGVWISLVAMIVVIVAGATACFKAGSEVIIYAAQDQQFAEPILKEFEKQTGIKVRAVYDSEAVKTVALANRLLAEAGHPRCDVWWSNEALRTRQLAAKRVFESNSIVEFGSRSRRVVVNTNKLATPPRSIVELTNAQWRGKVALAYPMFGTTSAHFIALRREWGIAAWEQWCTALVANKPFLLDGNSAVVKLVGRGEAWIGMTDFDDIAAGQREGFPIVALPLSDGSLSIPNSVAIVQGAPHRDAAAKLQAYIISDAVVEKLIAVSALEGKTAEIPADFSWAALVPELEPAAESLKRIFLR